MLLKVILKDRWMPGRKVDESYKNQGDKQEVGSSAVEIQFNPRKN